MDEFDPGMVLSRCAFFQDTNVLASRNLEKLASDFSIVHLAGKTVGTNTNGKQWHRDTAVIIGNKVSASV